LHAKATSVFASRDFRYFYLGQAASYAGDGLRTIAIPLLVFKVTGSALNLGFTFALEYFAFGAFSLIGGSLADRINRKELMIACDIVRFLIIAAFAVAYDAGWLSVGMVYGGIVLHASCGAIFNGGQASSIPYVLGKDRATRAVAALQGTESVMNTIAPPVGGALFGMIGPLPALIVNAVTYVASLGSLSIIRDLGPERASGVPTLREIGHDIALGFRFLLADRAMRLLTQSSFIGNFIGMVGFVAVVPFVKRVLGGSDFDVGVVYGALGFGAVIGALIAPRLKMGFGKILMLGYIFAPIVELPLLWTANIVVAAVVWCLASVASGFTIAHIISWRMRVIPEESVGRVFGAVRLLVLCGTLPGAILGGAIADRFGARPAIAVGILGSMVIVAWLFSHKTARDEAR
jgi:MFS family permease